MNSFQKYIDHYKLWRNDGEKAVINLNEITKYLGYSGDPYLYGSSFERFLQDNPGCIEVIKEWIGNNFAFDEFETEEDDDE